MHIAEPDPSAPALDEFRRLRREGALTPDEAGRLAGQAAGLFREYYTKSHAYLPGAITLLAELAAHPEPALAQIGAARLFPELVEWSADWFNPDYCRLYDRLFAQVIDVARRLVRCRELNFTLHGFGLAEIDDFLARRKAQLAPRPPINPAAERVKRILLLSRVTFGAEVAVTSVVIRRMRQLFPDAALILFAAPAIAQLFAGEPAVQVRDAHYPRGGALLDRLNSWPALTQAIADALAGLDSDEYLIIDPDSRLTQLGLLPVTSDEHRYLFFESRSYGAGEADSAARISELTARWLDERFEVPEGVAPALPFVSLAPRHNALRDALRAALKSDGRPLVCMSFGVGGNDAKRIGEAFERDLLGALVRGRARVLLVKGVGEEVERTQAHLKVMRARQVNIAEIRAADAKALPGASRLRRADVIAWEGELGAFSAVIAAADAYIGYDSGGSHIAAAQGVPVIDIFADDNIPMVTTRWTPTGPAPVHVIEHYTAPSETLDRVMAVYQGLLGARL